MTGRDQDHVDLTAKTVCVATFSFLLHGKRYGRTIYWHELLEYLRPVVGKLLYIEQPPSYAEDKRPSIEVYLRGELRTKELFPLPRALAMSRLDPHRTSLRLKLRDIASTVYLTVRERTRIDLFVGIESVNASVGIFLREIGIVKSVAYCVMDYMPRRSENPFMNGMFHALDRFCVRFSDYSWNATTRIESARRRYDRYHGGSVQLVVPLPCPEPMAGLESAGHGTKDIVYLGALFPAFGVERLLRAFHEVTKTVPHSRLHIIGDGPLRPGLERYVSENDLADMIIVHGVLDDVAAEGIVARSRFGVAPYLIESSNSAFVYGDTSKVKLYLTYGLPVIITKWAGSATAVVEHGAGIAVECTQEELASAITKLLTDEALCERLHTNALAMAADLRPEKVFREPVELGVSTHG